MRSFGKTFRQVLAVLLIVAAAGLFYGAGVGTGLHVARSVSVATVPLKATQMPPTAIPTATPTATAVPDQPTATATATIAPPPAPTATPTVSPTPVQAPDDGWEVFWEAWDLLQDQFYGELPTEQELPYAAIEGVVGSTGDPYTAFLDPVRAEIISTDLSGSFEGIGATVRIRPDGKLEIVQPLPDHPAVEAGLKPKDIVLRVDDVDIEGMTIYEAIALIRGPAGTPVRLLIQRQEVEDPFEVEIWRARIDMPVVEAEMLDGGIAYLQLNDFGQTAPREVRDTLRELLAEDPVGLIFDLRGNGGGYLSSAVEVASEFVDQGPILIERFRDETERIYDAEAGGLATEIPLVVLVNGGTASASEIVAGAIQDTERGILVGTKTLGKGSVQLVNTLSDGSQLRVTTARWFTPNDREIHGVGLAPDLEVEITDEDLDADLDPQLEQAISVLLEGK